MPKLADTPFWSHYGGDVLTFARHVNGMGRYSRFFGLARKYPRLVEIAAACGVDLPEASAEWSCYYDDIDLSECSVLLLDDIVIR